MKNNGIKETKKGTSILSNSIIWFGAGVSIAEILTGTYFAPLGFAKGILAILIGHVIGCSLLFFAGYIGALSKKSAMDSTALSFGKIGAKIFALFNVIQLVGWTGIMIYDASLSLNEIFATQKWVWAVITGLLIILWVIAGITNIGKFSFGVMIALFVLTIVMCKVVFSGGNSSISVEFQEALSFGQAIELAVAMPLSWLPLISDYTKEAEKPFAATFASSVTYCLVSCWMYIIGMGLAILTSESDIAKIMTAAGLGKIALVIIILSTVTTTFLDAWSAAISFKTIFEKVPEKLSAIIVTVIGTLAAILFPMDNITDFLYLIGSIFAPMIAILLADYFILKSDFSEKKLKVSRVIIWLIGFVIYRLLMKTDLITGCTIPDMVMTFALTAGVGLIENRR
ncbi:MAG: putative hydroxymethylpyrimidine transporter CytX [Spirochaetales bacterium]|nr:putative hydroxymethylpyrimidine transporter CytX [Spirochaetales bacterium]